MLFNHLSGLQYGLGRDGGYLAATWPRSEIECVPPSCMLCSMVHDLQVM